MNSKSLLILCLISLNTFSQIASNKHIYKKGTFSMYWGWNRAAYSKSDITFKGTDYNFELTDVIAKDRQSPFSVRTYFSPTKMTIPQYNFRIGYFIKDHYQLSFGADHMKYVMEQYNTVKINGTISNSGTFYDGVYENADVVLADTFLKFEHTDGLNYENFELRRFDVLFQMKNFCFSANEGLGVGFLLPRTNTTLLNNPRYDEFHLAGFGVSAVLALNLTFFNYFFIQSEWKGGFISMPDIRTTMHKEDRASQHFLFSQYNVVFGANFRIPSKKNPKD